MKALQEQLTDEDLIKEIKRLRAEVNIFIIINDQLCGLLTDLFIIKTPALEEKLEGLSSNKIAITEADRRKAEASYQRMRVYFFLLSYVFIFIDF